MRKAGFESMSRARETLMRRSSMGPGAKKLDAVFVASGVGGTNLLRSPVAIFCPVKPALEGDVDSSSTWQSDNESVKRWSLWTRHFLVTPLPTCPSARSSSRRRRLLRIRRRKMVLLWQSMRVMHPPTLRRASRTSSALRVRVPFPLAPPSTLPFPPPQ